MILIPLYDSSSFSMSIVLMLINSWELMYNLNYIRVGNTGMYASYGIEIIIEFQEGLTEPS